MAPSRQAQLETGLGTTHRDSELDRVSTFLRWLIHNRRLDTPGLLTATGYEVNGSGGGGRRQRELQHGHYT